MNKALTKLNRLADKVHTIDETSPLSGKALGEMLLALLTLIIYSKHLRAVPPKDYAESKLKIMDLSDTLPDNQLRIFNVYAGLHNAVVRGQREETLFISQFFHAFYKLQCYQRDVMNCEDRFNAAANRPLIITKPAYDALVKKAGSNNPEQIAALFDENAPKQYILRSQIINGGIAVKEFEPSHTEKGFTDGIYTADIENIDTDDIDCFLDRNIDYYGDVRFQLRCMFEAVCNMYLYNAYIKTALDGLKIDYMDEVYINTERVEIALEQYNECCEKAVRNIIGTEKEKDERRTVLQKLFTPVPTARIKEFADNNDEIREHYDKMKGEGRLYEYSDDTLLFILDLTESFKTEVFG